MKYIDKKISFIIFFIVLIFFVLVGRIFYLSVIQYSDSFDKTMFYNPVYKRADIVDRNNIIVASNIKVKTLYLNKLMVITWNIYMRQ